VSILDLNLEPKAAAVRRVKAITGGGGRRRWSDDEKARAIEASLVRGAVAPAVARRHVETAARNLVDSRAKRSVPPKRLTA
jgi:transposase